MDIAPEQLQYLSFTEILKEATSIPKLARETFSLITLILLFPLSFAILAHFLFTYPILNQIQLYHETHNEWTHLLIFQFSYIIFMFAFSLLSTADVVFTVASLYTSKPVSFGSTISAIPRVFKRLLINFLFVIFLMVIYNLIFVALFVILIVALELEHPLLFVFSLIAVFLLFLVVHIYITTIWHWASVVSVLEPIYGFAAMKKKSRELFKGKTKIACELVFGYLFICGGIGGVFGVVVVHSEEGYGLFVRILVGVNLIGLLVIVNFIGLLVQSVFYYVCKSYHHQGIDKSALYDHLGGSLGEYVPLKSSTVQMESMEI